jgi:beta-1,4-N-acetylglucosaminyltransferase
MSSLSSSARATQPYHIPLLLIALSLAISLSIFLLTRFLTIVLRPNPTSLGPACPSTSRTRSTHLLVILGSGGHTAEMLNMLRRVPQLPAKFNHRTYVVSSEDAFSTLKAKEFEIEISGPRAREMEGMFGQASEAYDIVIVRRARRVHQSLFSTPWSVLLCLWDCLKLLMGARSQRAGRQLWRCDMRMSLSYPDLILTNGPGTGVCIVLASLILRFIGLHGLSSPSLNNNIKDILYKRSQRHAAGQMRTIFIESWARVRTLSLTGKILLPLVDRFLVQWPNLEGRGGGKAEFVGALVG